MAEGKKEMEWKLTEEDMQLGFEEAMPLMPSLVAEACDSNSKVFFALLILYSFFFVFFFFCDLIKRGFEN